MGVEDFPGATLLPQRLQELLIETLEDAQQSCINPEMRKTIFWVQIGWPARGVATFTADTLCFAMSYKSLHSILIKRGRLHNVSQLLGYPHNQSSGPGSGRFASLSSSTTTATTWEQRMLCCLTNCAYCNKSFFHQVGKLFEKPILEPIVLTISEELARLMSCVQQFSYTGAIQASVDIRLLRDALKLYTNETGRNYFLEALEAINPPLDADQNKKADEILERVKDRMKLQLMCFIVKDP
ncbi:Exocyst complex component 2 [Eumeta japonica]|uniref:Exocyst complex component 2 n=1 Tax=Eumeta variegata TaxID=151549 RepID=A0A4C1THS0_EUMVA|nr:Exocyst complex component 2 [Eumeta japonica]